jgi:hypothetical protein
VFTTVFAEVLEPKTSAKRSSIAITDHLMSGLAVFGLKCASLLAYDRKRKDPPVQHNLANLYHVKSPPSDTYLRERLDEVDPKELRPAFKKIFALFQRGKGLEEFEYMDGAVLLSGDGTGHFSSTNISCPCCCQKKHRNGAVSYYHQMFGVCIVHPDKRNVIPLCPEPILNRDGSQKNDCERNACKRFLENFRREHPHLKGILLEDGLSSNEPNIKMIKAHKLHYILVAKPGDHEHLFDQLRAGEGTKYHEIQSEDGGYHQFHYLNGVELNKSHPELKVNVLEYRFTDKKGKETNFSWVTDLDLSKKTVLKISKAGRARWKIENETFNTLKNLGYNFEHNYGHGKKNLATIFCMLMMLSFLIDQLQELSCVLYRRCKERLGTYRELWETLRVLIRNVRFESWEEFYGVISTKEAINSS